MIINYNLVWDHSSNYITSYIERTATGGTHWTHLEIIRTLVTPSFWLRDQVRRWSQDYIFVILKVTLNGTFYSIFKNLTWTSWSLLTYVLAKLQDSTDLPLCCKFRPVSLWVVLTNFTLLSLFAQSGVTDNQSWENGRAWPLWSHRSPTARAYKSWAYQSNIIVSILPSVCCGINLQSLATAHLNSAFNPMVFATYLVIRENSTLF